MAWEIWIYNNSMCHWKIFWISDRVIEIDSQKYSNIITSFWKFDIVVTFDFELGTFSANFRDHRSGKGISIAYYQLYPSE